MSATDVRLAMRANGFSPIPCSGKAPTIPGWQRKVDASPAEMALWSGANTGVLTALTPAIDIDVTDPEAAGLAEEVGQELFGDRGVIPVRFGRSPKRALVLRTAAPFAKMSASYEAPNGATHKIEILADGQQLVCFGIHPDIGQPYTWCSRTPLDTPRAELAEVDEADMQTYLELVSERLAEEYSFKRVYTNGHDDELGAPGPVDVDDRLRSMRFGGAGDNSVHATQLHVTASLLRSGVGLDETVRIVLEATQRAVASDRRAQKWRWDDEQLAIERMCASFVSKNPELAGVLPDELREQFETKHHQGRAPYLVYRRDRGWQIAAAKGMGDRRFGRLSKGLDVPARAGAKPQSGNGDMPLTKLRLRAFVPINPATLPPREWLYGKHYQRRTVGVTASPGGSGKTSLVMVEAVAMATTRNLLGEQPPERLRVWYHNGEDSRDELNRRLLAICQHYKISQEELVGYFFLTSGNEFPLRVAKGYNDLKIDTPLLERICEEVAGNEIDVVILDPLVTLHNVSESDNNRMDTVVRLFAAIADEQDCAFELEHHTRKLRAGDTELDGDDMRGASAIRDAVRAARVLNHMSMTDAMQLAIPEHERLLYFRVDKAKGNNAAPSQAVWRRFVNVELINGDDVGVVVPYALPGQGERTEAMAAAEATAERVFLALLARLTLAGVTVNDKPRGRYAPRVFAKEPEAKLARISMAAFEEAMRRLIKSGHVRVAHVTLRGREGSYLEAV